eukprot:gene17394-24037_t
MAVLDLGVKPSSEGSSDAGSRRLSPAAARGLVYDAAVKAETDHLYEIVRHVISPLEWPAYAPLIAAINRLKKERDAVILAHNYMTAEIFNCVGDFRGDSLGLAREAAKVSAKVIVQGGVHFMAETSKILSPDKTVLIPSLKAGCSLAASITGADVRLIKARYPGLPVVTYVNTTAEVKAESDICCTSSNAIQVVETIAKEWGVDQVIMLPDEYLAKNVAAQTGIKIISWKGKCEVHERFTADDIAEIRASHPGAIILAHPECPPEVVAAMCLGQLAFFVRADGAYHRHTQRPGPLAGDETNATGSGVKQDGFAAFQREGAAEQVLHGQALQHHRRRRFETDSVRQLDQRRYRHHTHIGIRAWWTTGVGDAV